jgi:hypothetical protein
VALVGRGDHVGLGGSRDMLEDPETEAAHSPVGGFGDTSEVT